MTTWKTICKVEDIPVLGARRLARKQGADVAVFRNAENKVFALLDVCPHKQGPLSQGIVFGESVACPLHNWTIGLADGCAKAPDEGCTTPFAVKVEDGQVSLDLDELNSLALGTVIDPRTRLHDQANDASKDASKDESKEEAKATA
jgi:nitrite reductase (NADH) small subunit